jgi:hypothetical protein
LLLEAEPLVAVAFMVEAEEQAAISLLLLLFQRALPIPLLWGLDHQL